MEKKKVELSESESKFIEAMRKRPQMSKRFEAILAMSMSEGEDDVKKADEIEAMLVEEVRRLGAEQVIGQAHQKKHAGSYCAKKKT
jgi:hypothetical protein